MKTDANDRARVELALAQFTDLLSDDEMSQVLEAVRTMVRAGGSPAQVADDLEEGLGHFPGQGAVH